MAKSYITKFVEYVDTCKETLKANLSEKGSYVDENDTLDSLVNRVGSIQPPAQPESEPLTYVRDSVLPDLDTMFDEDPLRRINGGEYKACAYIVGIYGSYNTSYDVSFAFNWTTGSIGKIIIEKSGREITVTSSGNNIKFNDDEIYTLSDGRKVWMVKLYSTYDETKDIQVLGGFNYIYPLEVIDDCITSSCSYQLNCAKYAKLYIPATSKGFSGFNNIGYDTHAIINGNVTFTNSGYMPKYMEINGDYIGANNTVSISNYYSCPTTKFIVPAVSQLAQYYGDMLLQLSIQYWERGSQVYIPNSYKRIYTNTTTNSVPLAIETMHFPNSITETGNYDWFTSNQGPMFYTLRNLTMSPNAFEKFTAACTLYFDRAPNLTVQSLTNIVEALADRTGMTAGTVRFSKYYHQKNITDEQITSLQSRNWTVSFV